MSFCSQGRKGGLPTPLDADPVGLGRPPWMQTPGVGQTPQMQAILGGLGRPPMDADPPGLDRPPWMQTVMDADPPGLGRSLPGCRLLSPGLGRPLWMQTPQGWADPPIRSTSGRDASYWNAYLSICEFDNGCRPQYLTTIRKKNYPFILRPEIIEHRDVSC